MRILSVALSGWMPFRETVELELPHGPIAIVGTHANDPRRSNRAGKTSLLEALTWCLYGLHRKRLDDKIINEQSDACEVQVAFEGMLVKRSRRRGQSTKLQVELHDVGTFVGSAAEDAIFDYIGVGSQDYLATQCFRQGDVESIISRTAGDRLALVSEWLQQGKWLEAKRLQAAKSNIIMQSLASKREALSNAESDVLTSEQRLAMLAEIQKLKLVMSDCERQMAELRERMREGLEAQKALLDHDQLERLRSEAQEARKVIFGGTKLQNSVQESDQKLQIARQELASALKEHDELAAMQRDGFDGRCPVTCEDCPVSDHVSEVVQVATGLLQERKVTVGDKQAVLSEVRAENARLYNESKAQERHIGHYKALTEQGKRLAASIALTREQAEAVPSIEPLQGELHVLQTEYGQASRRIGELEAMIDNAKRVEERIGVMSKQISSIELEAHVSQLALRAISSVPARIAAEQLGELEREANMLLSGSGVSLRFSWQRELNDKSPLCEECGFVFKGQRGNKCPACEAPRGKKTAQELELLCDDGSGAEEDVRFNSGGTRAIVGSAIRLAASAMLRRLRSTEASWAIVDEPFGSLDAENREQLARTFAGMLGSVGFDQALVVSHDPILLGALPHRIVIDKDGATSTARLE